MSKNQLIDGLTPDQCRTLGDLEPLIEKLTSEQPPSPTPAESARLLASLEAYLPAPTKAKPTTRNFSQWVSLAWEQSRLLRGLFWVASGLFIFLGIFFVAFEQFNLLPVFILALGPVISMAGIAYLFRPATRTLADLELLTATPPLALLYLRVLLVVGFSLLSTLLMLLLAGMQWSQWMLWRITLVWISPTLGLAGLALWITVRWGALPGIVLPLGGWAALILAGWQFAAQENLNLADITMQIVGWANTSPTALFTSIGLVLLGCLLTWLAGKKFKLGTDTWN